MSNKSIAVYAKAFERKQEEERNASPAPSAQKTFTSKVTPKATPPREPSRDIVRESPRANSRSLPTRDEIQEFSFRLRDELKVKVQAEVPHFWQKEFEEIARELDVKKLELYRFILGEFLGKVRRGKKTD